ncbi:MAG: hypothetical protein EB078_11975, partial [Proteobacteria bacterium]|nr:hypothetical protein [Pseudomonadota bacterium]NDD05616.1 hypothetical protein [Pseudomonadota bacterium]
GTGSYSSASSSVTPAAFVNPTSIAGLQLWLDASDASTLYSATSGGSLVAADGAVARWEDKSGNGRHATQETSGNRPQRKSSIQNSKDILRFDGSNDLLRTSANFPVTGNIETTVFVVYKKTNNAKGHIFGWGDSGVSLGAFGFYDDGFWTAVAYAGGKAFFTSGPTNNTWFVSMFRKSAGAINSTTEARRNSVSVATSNHSTDTPNVQVGLFSVGRWANYDLSGTDGAVFQGDLAEIIIYNSALSDSDRSAVEGYLMSKWGIQ